MGRLEVCEGCDTIIDLDAIPIEGDLVGNGADAIPLCCDCLCENDLELE